MKKLSFFFLVFILLLGSGHTQMTYDAFADSLQGNSDSWVNQRVENAKNGIIEKVEMPLVVRTKAWGCRCPDNYIGVGANVKECSWIFPIAKKKLPSPDEKGYSLVVTGYFTGKWKVMDLRANEKEPEEWIYTVAEFNIISWKMNTQEYKVDAPKVVK